MFRKVAFPKSLLRPSFSFSSSLSTKSSSLSSFEYSRSFSNKKRNDEVLVNHLRSELKGIENAGTYKKERIITSPQSASIKVFDGTSTKTVLNFWFFLKNFFFF